MAGAVRGVEELGGGGRCWSWWAGWRVGGMGNRDCISGCEGVG